MKIFIVLLSLAIVVCIHGLTDEEEWANFKVFMNFAKSSADRCPLQIKFNRIYDAEEDKRRFKIFKKTLAKVAAQNERYDRGESTWQAGINEFSDQTGFPG